MYEIQLYSHINKKRNKNFSIFFISFDKVKKIKNILLIYKKTLKIILKTIKTIEISEKIILAIFINTIKIIGLINENDYHVKTKDKKSDFSFL